MTNAVAKTPEKQVTVKEYADTMIASVLTELDKRKDKGFMLPQNYAVQNAVMTAMYQISRAVDKNGNPVMQVCTASSIQESLLNMVTKGLDPGKKQCYFIPYGNKLECMESYFGVKMMAKRADPNIEDINSTVVYTGDKFSYTIDDATITNIVHEQDPDNIDIANIKGAYATILYRDGKKKSEYMTYTQIKTSWSRGTTKGTSSAHKENPEEMCKRTVTKRLVKNTTNTATDAALFYDDEDEENIDAVHEELEATAVISIPAEFDEQDEPETEEAVEEENLEAEPVTVKEPKPKQAAPAKVPEQTSVFDV